MRVARIVAGGAGHDLVFRAHSRRARQVLTAIYGIIKRRRGTSLLELQLSLVLTIYRRSLSHVLTNSSSVDPVDNPVTLGALTQVVSTLNPLTSSRTNFFIYSRYIRKAYAHMCVNHPVVK